MRELAHRAGDEHETEHLRAQWGHVVTRAVGHGDVLTPDVTELRLMAGDVLAPDDACEVLLARSIDAGSRDNVTACSARVT